MDENLRAKLESAKKNFSVFTLITEKEIEMQNFKSLWVLVQENKVQLAERSFRKVKKYIEYEASSVRRP